MWQLTLEPGPEAFMIRLLSTSAGEQTVVATVPCEFGQRQRLSKCGASRKTLTAAKLAVKWQ